MDDKSDQRSWSRALLDPGSGVIIIDTHFNVLYSSEKARSLIGSRRGKKCYSFNPAGRNGVCPDCPCLDIFRRKKLAKKHIHVLDIDENGGNTFLEVVATPVTDPEGETVGAVLILHDLTALERASREIEKKTDHLQQILDSSPDMMITIDSKGFVTNWNRAAQEMTGLRHGDMMGRNLLLPANNIESITKIMKESITSSAPCFRRIQFRGKGGGEKCLLCSTTIIRDRQNLAEGVLLTAKPTPQSQILEKGIKEGYTYFLTGKDRKKSIKIFSDLLGEGYRGMLLTRDDPSDFSHRDGADILWLTSRKSEKFSTAADCDQVIRWLERQLNNNGRSAILVDRADYLATLHGFDKFIRIIYSLNDKVVHTKHVALINLNPSAFDEHQLNIIRQELRSPHFLEKKISLSERQLSLLHLVRNKNMYFRKVYFKDISKEFSISKITTKKLISSLADLGLINVKKMGRVKVVELTDEGKFILSSEPSN